MDKEIQETSFGARARVIDLLGREQIADAPTAISELLKNAVDARAAHATIRFSSEEKRLDIEDDGLGMRTQDVLQKWLVVATESKRTEPDQAWLQYASEAQRRVFAPLGEKGIGRLAIAALGAGVLVWTRWGKGVDLQRTMLLVHWGVFQHPHLSLDQIKIPYRTYGPNEAASVADALQLMDQLEAWMLATAPLWKSAVNLRGRIAADLKVFFRNGLANNMKLANAPGTLFAILGASEEVEQMFAAEDRVGEEVSVNEALKLVLGFNDFLTQRPPRLSVTFELDNVELAAERSFWRPEDLLRADHEIDLNCDENGFVSGRVRVYGDWHDYEFSPGVLPDRTRLPGPFSLRLGYIAGQDKSRLSPDEFNSYDERLKAYGALYLYRDDIRILPYGQQDNDFLQFELRRSLNAGRYFFSHRRMFGVLELTTSGNPELRDKAGREGFIKNAAYRGLVFLLRKTFVDLAHSYYGSDAKKDSTSDKRSDRQDEAAERAKARAEKALTEFLANLEKWRAALPKIVKAVNGKLAEFNRAADAADASLVVTDEHMTRCEELLREAADYFHGRMSGLAVEVPSLVTLTADQVQAYDAYMQTRDETESDLADAISDASVRLALILARAEADRAHAVILNRATQARNALHDKITELEMSFRRAASTSLDFLPRWRASQRELLDQPFVSRFPAGLEAALLDMPLPDVTRQVEEAIGLQQRIFMERIRPFWQAARHQVEHLNDAELAELEVGELNRSLERLRDREQMFAELAQLGLVIESLDHDYYMLFGRIHEDIERVGRFASGSPELARLYQSLHTAFGSLQTKQGFLRPLYRQRFGTRGRLTGPEIADFINGFYIAGKDQKVQVTANGAFDEFEFEDVNKPVVLAAIVNIVQNGLYWATKGKSQPEVRLTVEGRKLVISNSGPRVQERDKERIFEPFFSRRPNGRGLGLYIAKTNLASSGLLLYVQDETIPGALGGAKFVIEEDDK